MNEEIKSLLTKLNDNIETGFKDVNKRIDKLESVGKTFEKGLFKLKQRAGEAADMNNTDREYFYELVDNIPDDKLDELVKVLLIMAMPEYTPTEEEVEAIRRGKEQIANGESILFNTYEEMSNYFMNEDDID